MILAGLENNFQFFSKKILFLFLPARCSNSSNQPNFDIATSVMRIYFFFNSLCEHSQRREIPIWAKSLEAAPIANLIFIVISCLSNSAGAQEGGPGRKAKHFLLAAGPCIPLGDGKVGSGLIRDFWIFSFSVFVVLPARLEGVHG